jgi:hypothetical protein
VSVADDDPAQKWLIGKAEELHQKGKLKDLSRRSGPDIAHVAGHWGRTIKYEDPEAEFPSRVLQVWVFTPDNRHHFYAWYELVDFDSSQEQSPDWGRDLIDSIKPLSR